MLLKLKSQFKSEIHDLSVRYKDYEKKIMDTCENVELMAWSHANKYLRSNEFKVKVFEQSIHFYSIGFNNDLLKA